MADLRSALQQRVADVEGRIQAACARAGRDRRDVTLVAVTKTVEPEVAALMPELGVNDLGESRPQELWRKAASLSTTVRWHLVGHLQRNKIERTLPLVHLLHSVDSVRLLTAVDEWCEPHERTLPVLLEVNASGETNKHGFRPDELSSAIDALSTLRQVHVRGLMTMAAYEDDPQRCRPTFALLRRLRDDLRGRFQPPHQLLDLSMGMSNEFEVAIEEGATLVRIGTSLFEGLPPA